MVKKNTILWIFGILIVLAGIGIGIYFLLKKRKPTPAPPKPKKCGVDVFCVGGKACIDIPPNYPPQCVDQDDKCRTNTCTGDNKCLFNKDQNKVVCCPSSLNCHNKFCCTEGEDTCIPPMKKED